MCQYYVEIKNVLKVIINMGNSHTATLSREETRPPNVQTLLPQLAKYNKQILFEIRKKFNVIKEHLWKFLRRTALLQIFLINIISKSSRMARSNKQSNGWFAEETSSFFL